MWGTNRGLFSKLNSICKKKYMVSCQEPSSLKGSKYSLQCHPHDSVLVKVNAHSFVSMGVETKYFPCHSAAHHWHMKKQPSLCHCCPHHGCYYCNHRCHLRCHCSLHCCCCCHRCCRRPLLLPLPSTIAFAVAIAHCRHCLCPVAVSHCHHHCHPPCHRP